MRRTLKYRGETYQLFKGYYVAGNRICITAETRDPTYKVHPITLNYATKSAPLTRNQAFINTPFFGFGIIGALIEIKAGKDTGLAIFDEDGNEIPIFEFDEKFLKNLN